MSLMICDTTKYCSGDQSKKNEISLACSTDGASRGGVHTGFWWWYLKDRGHLEELCIDGRLILNWMFNKSVRSSWRFWCSSWSWGTVSFGRDCAVLSVIVSGLWPFRG